MPTANHGTGLNYNANGVATNGTNYEMTNGGAVTTNGTMGGHQTQSTSEGGQTENHQLTGQTGTQQMTAGVGQQVGQNPMGTTTQHQQNQTNQMGNTQQQLSNVNQNQNLLPPTQSQTQNLDQLGQMGLSTPGRTSQNTLNNMFLNQSPHGSLVNGVGNTSVGPQQLNDYYNNGLVAMNGTNGNGYGGDDFAAGLAADAAGYGSEGTKIFLNKFKTIF